MIRFFVRTLGLWLLAGSFAAAVIDGMKSIAGSALRMTAALETWTDLAPSSVTTAHAFVESHLGPAVWSALETGLRLVPTWALLGVLAAVLIALARPRPAPIGVTP
jgi:hypothetical protein